MSLRKYFAVSAMSLAGLATNVRASSLGEPINPDIGTTNFRAVYDDGTEPGRDGFYSRPSSRPSKRNFGWLDEVMTAGIIVGSMIYARYKTKDRHGTHKSMQDLVDESSRTFLGN